MGRWMIAAVVASIAFAVAFPLAAALAPRTFWVLAYTCAYWLLGSFVILAANVTKLRGGSGDAARRDYLLLASSTLALVAEGIAVYRYSSSNILSSNP